MSDLGYYKIFPGENYFDLTLFQFGYEECLPSHLFGPATRNHFLFHYILSGKGTLRSINDKGKTNEFHLEGSHGFLIWPGQHNTYFADEKNPWVYTWVEFDGMKAREFVIQSGLTYNNPVYTSQVPSECEKMKNELLYLAHNANNPPLELMGHFYLFLSAMINSSAGRRKIAGGNLNEFYIHEAVAFIERHYQDEITIEDIANFCNLDRSYLGKMFKCELKISPQGFLIRFRMNKACELMKITKHSIGEISAMVGYQDIFSFSRAFKQMIGKSPRKWREENKLR